MNSYRWSLPATRFWSGSGRVVISVSRTLVTAPGANSVIILKDVIAIRANVPVSESCYKLFHKVLPSLIIIIIAGPAPTTGTGRGAAFPVSKTKSLAALAAPVGNKKRQDTKVSDAIKKHHLDSAGSDNKGKGNVQNLKHPRAGNPPLERKRTSRGKMVFCEKLI